MSAVVFTERGTGSTIAISTTASISPSSSFSATNSSSLNSAGVVTVSCGLGAQLIALNAAEYCADDVANDTVLGGPGYSYFRNESITFMGVTFETICPSEYMGCPGANSTATLVTLGIMRFTMAFPDKTNETQSGAIGDATYIPILSSHSNPRAGMLIEITYGNHVWKSRMEITYGAHETTDHVFLLVEGPGAGISSNTAVATVTVTKTIITQASQPTTTYAAPPNCGTFFVKVTTTITTTIGAASTTTVTVTTTSTSYTQTVTSTSYTQTVTSTSCTYSTPTVTSTVTTTANP